MSAPPLICFSHLRWDFVYQRPQHLMARFARNRLVVFFQEAIQGKPGAPPRLATRRCPDSGVMIVTPELPDPAASNAPAIIRSLLDGLCAERRIVKPVLWYYTPMMRAFSRFFRPPPSSTPAWMNCQLRLHRSCLIETSRSCSSPPTVLTAATRSTGE